MKIWLLLCCVGLASCTLKPGSTFVPEGQGKASQSPEPAPRVPSPAPTAAATPVSAEILGRALNSAAKILVDRLPSSDEMKEGTAGLAGYEKVIRTYLASISFRQRLHKENQNFHKLGGTAGGVNRNEPANFATYLVLKDLDYREILTADYCVDDNLNAVSHCDAFPDPATAKSQAAGVMTTRAFLSKWTLAGFNFNRVKESFSQFLCASYPDGTDLGLTVDEVASSVKEFNSTSGAGACYNCHRSMNSKAALFFSFNLEGRYTSDRGTSTKRDGGAVDSALTDVLSPVRKEWPPENPQVVQPKAHGRNVNKLRDLALLMAEDPRFAQCTVQRYANFLLGRGYHEEGYMTPLPASLQPLVEDLKKNGFRVREILVKILKSDAFLR